MHPFWCRSRDLNPDGFCPLPPQDSVSTIFHHFGIQITPPCLPERAFTGDLSVRSAFVNIKRGDDAFPRREVYFAVCGPAGAFCAGAAGTGGAPVFVAGAVFCAAGLEAPSIRELPLWEAV